MSDHHARTLNSQLLPCPFCGGKAEVLYDNWPAWLGGQVFIVECVTCGTHAPGGWKETQNVAEQAWNHRVPTVFGEVA
jgi:Lar family restriction alleviation protein